MPKDEPQRRPDLWLAPPADNVPPPPSLWAQPPAWRERPPGAPTEPSNPAGPRWPAAARATSVRRRRPLLGLGLAIGFLFLLMIFVQVAGLAATRRDRSTTPPVTTRPGAVPNVWSIGPARLSPTVTGARFLGSIDGSFQQSYVAEVGGLWLTTTGDPNAASTALHALDPATGEVRWQRDLDGVLCATEAPKAGLLCASVLERDPATGLGTRWRLHRLDLTTGQDRATRDVDGWFTAVHWSGSTFVGLEQREPSPHAVVRGFAVTDLRPVWTVDLAREPGQAEMFSEDRIIRRPEPERPGVALDRPRLRDVGDGLVAVWAGQRTAFVDPGSGRLVMMPHCSRLVDDGTRLWCNEVDGATAYAYDGRRLVRVRGPRLAFPGDDGIGVDRSRPVFLDDDGAAVSVDVKTGKVGSPWTPPGRGSAFGVTTMPSAATTGDRTFLVGGAGTMLLDGRQDRVVWRLPGVTVGDVPIVRGDEVLVGTSRLTRVDLVTGQAGDEIRTDGLYTVAVGDRVAGVGPEGISLVDL
ncbi:PQQ-binding-like beta-propeller repeat protein [Microlunatus antarcticus]